MAKRGASTEIEAELRDLIAAGELPAGAVLPTERDLAERHDVQRDTVRRAIRALEADGTIGPAENSTGRVVRRYDRIPWHLHDPLTLDGTPLEPTVTEVSVTTAHEPATLLGAEPDTPLVVRRRHVNHDEVPHLLIDSYYLLTDVQGTSVMHPPSRTDTTSDGPETLYGTVDADTSIICRMPTADETSRLHLPPMTPVAHVARTGRTTEDHPLALITIARGDRVRLALTLPQQQ